MKTPNNSQLDNTHLDSSDNENHIDSSNPIEKHRSKTSGSLYQASVAIRASIAAVGAVGGHVFLERFGVPHGVAEQAAVSITTLLFAPEIVVAGVKFASSDILEKVKNIKK